VPDGARSFTAFLVVSVVTWGVALLNPFIAERPAVQA
jgi:hypothetical protein